MDPLTFNIGQRHIVVYPVADGELDELLSLSRERTLLAAVASAASGALTAVLVSMLFIPTAFPDVRWPTCLVCGLVALFSFGGAVAAHCRLRTIVRAIREGE